MYRLFATTALVCAASFANAQDVSLRVLGQPVGSGLIQQQKEQPFFEDFAANAGMDVNVEYLPVDVAGIPDTDGMRVLRTGLFDIVSVRGPQVSRDEPTMLGLDLVGLNPDYASGKAHTDAFLPVVDAAVQQRFNAKLLGVWPAGPQVVFCKPDITGLADLEGLKVRVGDQSAAAFVAQFGATGVPLPFGEVQQSLARGVVDCAITGPSSANSAGWPEVTTTVLPIALQLAMNGYAMNLDSWNKLTEEQQGKVSGAIDSLVGEVWAYSEELYADAMNCNTGKEPCEHGTPYSLAAVEVSEADLKAVSDALVGSSLPAWTKQCNAVNESCEADWMATVGAKLGL
ncbi:TRAP transporter substrate-binding protein [Pseudooceanicola nitratireducens]|uniref:TRAP transporter substrate-binding protein n=1 Tax=Pseudooceanicola nitratireducens TaxID=517719 RepID=UPI001C987C17|nr:TRAP transporter substrate-binding protein [Pseudooceanicola nitratireducens]MBY6166225.1 TRAP transporter substrate-binding protein [Pseudooceanicola nitratireducens]